MLSNQTKGGLESFNGRKGAIVPQSGDYTASMVGALPFDGIATKAGSLRNPRTINIDLNSDSNTAFDGTTDIISGTTGVLPVANGGTGVNTIEGLKKLITENVPFDWGDENVVGDATWWSNLRTWVINATDNERQACIGKRKGVSLSSPVGGFDSEFDLISMICIGADQDGIGTLTFQTQKASFESDFGTSSLWNGSNAQSLCNQFGEKCSASASLKSITKLTGITQGQTEEETTAKCWIPSACEMGIRSSDIGVTFASESEWTKGIVDPKPYSYYIDDNRRVKQMTFINETMGGAVSTVPASYWTRTRVDPGDFGDNSLVVIGETGFSEADIDFMIGSRFAPAFTIG